MTCVVIDKHACSEVEFLYQIKDEVMTSLVNSNTEVTFARRTKKSKMTYARMLTLLIKDGGGLM